MDLGLSVLVACLTVLAGALAAQQHPHKKVLILGAGMSGIQAASHLQGGGVSDFLVLEGQDYIGGRIKQVSFGGYKVEAGANWIHFAKDEGSAPLWKLKEANNETGIWCNYTNFIIRNETGADVTDLKALHRLEAVEGKLEDEQESRKKLKLKDIPGRIGMTLLGWIPKNPVEKVLEYFTLDFEYSKRPELVSFYNMFERGKDFFISDQRGFFDMLNKTVTGFVDKIKLQQTVVRIEYNKTAVKVTTAAGDVYTADYAICTFSTGVLASDMVTFQPPMPSWKKEAILKSPMSLYTKIYLKFDRKFWDDKEYILLAAKKRGVFPVFQDLERPGILPANSSMLLVTVTEDEGRRIEGQTDEETKQELTDMLRKMYGNATTAPTDIYYARWSKNPYVRGAYSEVVVGTAAPSFANLAKNLDNLYFAGEALDEDWYSYLQGAALTGKDKGQMLAKLIKCKEAGKNDCEPTPSPTPNSPAQGMSGNMLSVLAVVMVTFYFCVTN